MKKKKMSPLLVFIIILLTIIIVIDICKIKLMAGNYVLFNSIHLEIDIPKFIDVKDDKIYFIADNSNLDITKYCSNQDYFIKQLTFGDYIHTIVVGGDMDNLGFLTHVEYIGESNLNITSESIYRFPSNPDYDLNYDTNLPVWLDKALLDFGF